MVTVVLEQFAGVPQEGAESLPEFLEILRVFERFQEGIHLENVSNPNHHDISKKYPPLLLRLHLQTCIAILPVLRMARFARIDSQILANRFQGSRN